MRMIRFIFFIIVFILGCSFAFLNAQSVNLNFYFGQYASPLSLLLVIALGVGALLGILFSIFPYIRLKIENVGLRKRVKSVEQEVTNLRTFPLKDEN